MLKIVETQACTPRAHNLTSGIASAYGEVALGDLSKLQTSGNAVNPQNQIWFRYIGDRSYKKLKNVSCEYDRVNGWNSTLQAAWYIRHVCIIWFLWTKRTVWLRVLILSFTQSSCRSWCPTCGIFWSCHWTGERKRQYQRSRHNRCGQALTNVLRTQYMIL